MAEYKKYINALRKCAKEHENEIVSFSHVRTTDLCNDTADLLERLEAESNITIPIPEGATNGDMMKAVFPNIQWDFPNIQCNECDGVFYGYKTNDRIMAMLGVDFNWWNASYKKEVE